MSQYETLILERNGPVATLTLNRPEQLNAINGTLRRELVAAIEALNADDSVRVVVLTGAGRGFSAGADLQDFGDSTQDTIGDGTERALNQEYKPALMGIADSPKLWIAAVNGPAAGVGSAFALCCDLVVMAEEAYIYQAFAAISLVPDGGATWHLVRILGQKRAMEVILTGERLHGQRCLDWGLCNRVEPLENLLAAARDWAAELAEKAPLALRYSKESVAAAAQLSLPEVISNEARIQNTCISSDDFREGLAAFFEKRAPRWQGK
ncbi:MAG: enoyl-CoA hydratase/isomerase family protein [Pseudomonadota bacterium]